MTHRRSINEITSGQLDALYAEVDRLTAELADYDRRARQLEDLLGVANQTSNRSEAERARAVHRAEQLEAAITRARHVAALIEAGAPWTASHQDTARRIRAALEVPAHNAGDRP